MREKVNVKEQFSYCDVSFNQNIEKKQISCIRSHLFLNLLTTLNVSLIYRSSYFHLITHLCTLTIFLLNLRLQNYYTRSPCSQITQPLHSEVVIPISLFSVIQIGGRKLPCTSITPRLRHRKPLWVRVRGMEKEGGFRIGQG